MTMDRCDALLLLLEPRRGRYKDHVKSVGSQSLGYALASLRHSNPQPRFSRRRWRENQRTLPQFLPNGVLARQPRRVSSEMFTSSFQEAVVWAA